MAMGNKDFEDFRNSHQEDKENYLPIIDCLTAIRQGNREEYIPDM